ncbi:TolC family protein [Cupriavidus sp. 8B]
MSKPARMAACLPLLLAAGCTLYRPQPLPTATDFAADPAHVQVDAASMSLPALAAHRFDPANGLDITDVAMLAVVNNPDLKIARAGAHVSQAQAFAARLLPDPQFNLTRDFPVIGGPGTSTAFNAALSYAVSSLLTYGSTRDAARAEAQQADLNLLWQEWQVVAQARILFVRLDAAARRMALLARTRAVLAERYQRTSTALDRGLLTLDVVTPNLSALQDVDKQIHDLERQVNQARHDLNQLLGIAPTTELALKDGMAPAALDAAAVRALLPALPRRRPDLLALQAGYAAQDARYRAAILGQFPSLNVGVQRTRDTSNTYTRGFGITMSLPIFNGNRGEVAIQQATRDKLRTEYQQRLNASNAEIERLLAEQQINQRQLAETSAALAGLRQASERMRAAFAARNIDALALATLELSVLAKEVERVDLEQAMREQQIGLQALLGGDPPGAPPA